MNIVKLFISSLLIVSVINSQEIWEHFNSENTGANGLVSNDIRFAKYDNNGVLWVLPNHDFPISFDGTSWKKHDEYQCDETYQSNPLKCMSTMAYGPDGVLWFGGLYGAAKLDRGEWTVYDSANSCIPPRTSIRKFDFESDGTPWMATFNGIFRFIGDEWVKFSQVSTRTCLNLFIDDNDIKWVSTHDGLIRIDGYSVLTYNASNSALPDESIRGIIQDNDGIYWIATWGGLVSFDGISWRTYTTSNSPLPHRFVDDIICDSKNVKWFRSFKNGLISFDGATWNFYNKENSLISSNYFNSLTIDQNDNILISFSGHGVEQISESKEIIYYNTFDDGLPNNSISAIAIGKDDSIWVSTSDGISKKDGENWSLAKEGVEGLNFTSSSSSTLLFDYNNELWVGGIRINDQFEIDTNNYKNVSASTLRSDSSVVCGFERGDSIGIYKSGNWDMYKIPFSQFEQSYNSINDICIDNRDGKIWIVSSEAGVATFLNGEWEHFNTLNSELISNEINAVMQDKLGAIWFCSGEGVCRYFDGNWSIYTKENSPLISNIVLDLAIDVDSTVWLATSSGLSCFKNETWKSYTKNNSELKADFCRTIVVDSKGKKWIGTSDGLYSLINDNSTENFNVVSSITKPSCLFIKGTKLILNSEKNSNIKISIIDVRGRIIKDLNYQCIKGENIMLDLKNFKISSGLYFIKSRIGNDVNLQKVKIK